MFVYLAFLRRLVTVLVLSKRNFSVEKKKICHLFKKGKLARALPMLPRTHFFNMSSLVAIADVNSGFLKYLKAGTAKAGSGARNPGQYI